MRQEVKEKWLAALRSGNYTQAQGRLRVGDSFCCLGVLCDLAIADGVAIRWGEEVAWGEGIVPIVPREYPEGEDLLNLSVLPDIVIEWAGLPEYTGNPDLRYEYQDENRVALAVLNDNGFTFEQIADLIETHEFADKPEWEENEKVIG